MLFIASHNNEVIGSPMIASSKEQAIKITMKTAKDMKGIISSAIKEFEYNPQVNELNQNINACKANIEQGKEAKDEATKETVKEFKSMIKNFEREKKKVLKQFTDKQKAWSFKPEDLEFYVIDKLF